MIGAIKIKDGLFIGDELASQVGIMFLNLIRILSSLSPTKSLIS
jgi:hypothetical protein